MLLDRLAVAILLIPLAVWVVWLGGPLYTAAVLVMLTAAAEEYAHLFRSGGQRPARPVLWVAVPLLALTHALPGLNAGLALVLVLVAALAWHLVDYERGAPAAGTDFTITLAGSLYLGWMGGYFVALRLAPDGLWWSVMLFSSIWLADTGAYAFGRWLGRRKLAPRLSPKKTWEGFVGGIVGGALGSGLLSTFWALGAGPGSLVSWWTGACLGGLVGLAGPLGDLGISMLKRQTGVKDSGDVIAGHGGVLDRIDSWLVAIPIGYYVVLGLQAWLR